MPRRKEKPDRDPRLSEAIPKLPVVIQQFFQFANLSDRGGESTYIWNLLRSREPLSDDGQISDRAPSTFRYKETLHSARSDARKRLRLLRLPVEIVRLKYKGGYELQWKPKKDRKGPERLDSRNLAAYLEEAECTADEVPAEIEPAIHYAEQLRLFVGRETELERAQEALEANNGCVLIHGLPGIGKTMLAKKIVREQAAPDHMFLDVEGLGSVGILKRVKDEARRRFDNEKNAARFLPAGLYIVVDGLTDLKAIPLLLDEFTEAHLILTCMEQPLTPRNRITPIPLDGLSLDDAQELAGKYGELVGLGFVPNDVERVWRLLGRHSLAIDLALANASDLGGLAKMVDRLENSEARGQLEGDGEKVVSTVLKLATHAHDDEECEVLFAASACSPASFTARLASELVGRNVKATEMILACWSRRRVVRRQRGVLVSRESTGRYLKQAFDAYAMHSLVRDCLRWEPRGRAKATELARWWTTAFAELATVPSAHPKWLLALEETAARFSDPLGECWLNADVTSLESVVDEAQLLENKDFREALVSLADRILELGETERRTAWRSVDPMKISPLCKAVVWLCNELVLSEQRYSKAGRLTPELHRALAMTGLYEHHGRPGVTRHEETVEVGADWHTNDDRTQRFHGLLGGKEGLSALAKTDEPKTIGAGVDIMNYLVRVRERTDLKHFGNEIAASLRHSDIREVHAARASVAETWAELDLHEGAGNWEGFLNVLDAIEALGETLSVDCVDRLGAHVKDNLLEFGDTCYYNGGRTDCERLEKHVRRHIEHDARLYPLGLVLIAWLLFENENEKAVEEYVQLFRVVEDAGIDKELIREAGGTFSTELEDNTLAKRILEIAGFREAPDV